MHKQDRLTEGMHRVARILLTATTLAFIMGGVGQPVMAQDNGLVTTGISASIPKEFCVGKTRAIEVKVVRHNYNFVDSKGNVTTQRVPVDTKRTNITVNAVVADTGIAELLATSQITGFDPDMPGSAEFVLTGVKAGTTNILFTAKPPIDPRELLMGESDYVINATEAARRVPITVKDCKFSVTAFYSWTIENAHLSAMTTETLIAPDGDGNFDVQAGTTFTGYETCITQSLIPFSFSNPPIRLTGKVTEDGATVTLTLPSIELSPHATCKGKAYPPVTGSVPAITVTAGNSGDHFHRASTFSVGGGAADGFAVIRHTL